MPEGSREFRSYLQAKFALDSASLNPRVAAVFRRRVCALPSPRLLDVGTGTGATLRRLLELPLRGEAQLLGLDREAGSLAAARRGLARALREAGWQAGWQAGRRLPGPVSPGRARPGPGPVTRPPGALPALFARRGPRRVRIELVCGDLLQGQLPQPVAEGGFQVITAHAVLDLLPPSRALRRLGQLLQPGGLLYATLNYDGVTTLLPPEGPGGLERRLLARYDRSMELRRVEGARTGGAYSGRRLFAAALQEGFAVLAAGPSDWCVFPFAGRYGQGERRLLEAMLGFIAKEAAGDPALPAAEVLAWQERRRRQLRQGRLGLVVHQLDLLLELRSPRPKR